MSSQPARELIFVVGQSRRPGMGLPKKGTRTIVVDGLVYRWCVRYDGLH